MTAGDFLTSLVCAYVKKKKKRHSGLAGAQINSYLCRDRVPQLSHQIMKITHFFKNLFIYLFFQRQRLKTSKNMQRRGRVKGGLGDSGAERLDKREDFLIIYTCGLVNL